MLFHSDIHLTDGGASRAAADCIVALRSNGNHATKRAHWQLFRYSRVIGGPQATGHSMKLSSLKNCVPAVLLALTLAHGLAFAAAVRVESGALQGVTSNGLSVYKGVPYATPPLDNLRWREPQPVKPWKGVRMATAFAPACMQTGVSMPGETPPTISWTSSRHCNGFNGISKPLAVIRRA